MLAERIPHSGAVVVSDLVDGHLISRTYYGYTVREAKAEFRREVSPPTSEA